ncbi:MAG: PEGA domain-containing protein [Sandaracinaceae bacterium]
MRGFIQLCAGATLVLLLGLATAPVSAQDDPRAQAAVHFDRGIAFFNESRYDAALAELGRAHELAPAPATLYNLARVHAALGHAVEASAAYRAYLAEPGVGPERRAAVQAALDEQQTRIGHLRVQCDVAGATLSVDGVDVASTPLESPLPLSAGSHSVEVRAPGHETVRRAVSIAGQSTSRLEVSLREVVVPRGNLRVETSVPEVAIQVDGDPVGVTPLASTLVLRRGAHTVVARRPGYQPEERQVQIEEGAATELAFTMRRAASARPGELGRVRLHLPRAPHLVRIDGEPMLGEVLELPVGLHQLELEVTDRRPYESTFRVPSASTLDVTPPLAWTLEAREERVGGANAQRAAGIGLTVVGATTLITGVALLAWNETEIVPTDNRVSEIIAECERSPVRCAELEDEIEELDAQQQTQNVLRGVSVAATLLGAGLTAVGVGLWIAAPSEDDVDAGARARLSVRPGGLTLDGTF